MLQYLYAIMWLLIGLWLIFHYGRKEGRIFYVAGSFFLFLAVWRGTAAVTGMDLFHGKWGWGLRILSAVFLILLVPPFIKKYRQAQNRENPAADADQISSQDRQSDGE